MQSPLLVCPPKCNGTYCECPLLRDYMKINSGLQLTISPTFLSPMLSPVSNPSGGVVPIVARIR